MKELLSHGAKWIGVAGTIAVLAVVTGCGSSDDEASSGGAGTTSAQAGGALEKARTDAEKYTAPVTDWNAWAPPEAPKPKAGQNVHIITCTWLLPECKAAADDMGEAAQTIGWRPKLVDGTPDVAKQRQALQTAIEQRADGIIVDALDPQPLADLLQKASDQKIPVLMQAGVNIARYGGVDGAVPPSLGPEAEALAAWVADKSGGEAKVFMVEAANNEANDDRAKAFTGYLESFPGVEIVGSMKVPFSKVGPPLQQQITSMLQGKPKGSIDYIYAPFDGFAVWVVNALRSAGRDEIGVISFEANEQNTTFVAKGEYQVADAARSWAWCSWTSVDELNRAMNEEPFAGGKCPYMVFTKENVGKWAGKRWQTEVDFREEFKSLWGVS